MKKPDVKTIFDKKGFNLCSCHDGIWLYDKILGFNLSMKAKTKDDAFINALEYYQERLKEKENELNELKGKVKDFLSEIPEDF